MSSSIEEIALRFWAKVDVCGPDECWPWLACKDTSGYGRFKVGGKTLYAHQVALWLATGEIIRKGQVTRHTCPGGGTYACCNYAHLVGGTQLENMGDCRVAGRLARGEANGNAQLNEMALLIAYDLKGLFTQRKIARVLGVSQRQVGRIHRGEHWSWLTGAGK